MGGGIDSDHTMFKPIILSISLGCATLVALPASADTAKDRIIVELKEQGFREITISRTFLGRTRIVATGRGRQREVVLNGSNGVVLRDYLKELPEGGDDTNKNAADDNGRKAHDAQPSATASGDESPQSSSSRSDSSSDDSKSTESSSDKSSSDDSSSSDSSDDAPSSD